LKTLSELNYIHVHAQCVNRSAGISYPHSRACPLIGSFLLGLLIVTADKGKAIEILYSDVRSLVSFFWGFILWHLGTCFYVWQKRKNIKTLDNLIYIQRLHPPVQIRLPRVSMLFLLHVCIYFWYISMCPYLGCIFLVYYNVTLSGVYISGILQYYHVCVYLWYITMLSCLCIFLIYYNVTMFVYISDILQCYHVCVYLWYISMLSCLCISDCVYIRYIKMLPCLCIFMIYFNVIMFVYISDILQCYPVLGGFLFQVIRLQRFNTVIFSIRIYRQKSECWLGHLLIQTLVLGESVNNIDKH
jgi:hypothetical protein